MTIMTINELKEKALKYNATYLRCEPILTHNLLQGKFAFERKPERTFAITNDFLSISNQRMSGANAPTLKELQKWNKEAPEMLPLLWNKGFGELDREYIYTFPIVLGQVWGMLTKYNPVSHAEILDCFPQIGLTTVNRYYLDEKEMRVYVNKEKPGQTISFGTSIQNGTTGHVAFGFNSFYKYGDMEVSVQSGLRKKHLSGTTQVLEGIQEHVNLQDEMTTINWMEGHRLSHPNHMFNYVKKIMTDKKTYTQTDEELWSMIGAIKADNVYDLGIELMKKSNYSITNKEPYKKLAEEVFTNAHKKANNTSP